MADKTIEIILDVLREGKIEENAMFKYADIFPFIAEKQQVSYPMFYDAMSEIVNRGYVDQIDSKTWWYIKLVPAKVIVEEKPVEVFTLDEIVALLKEVKVKKQAGDFRFSSKVINRFIDAFARHSDTKQTQIEKDFSEWYQNRWDGGTVAFAHHLLAMAGKNK